MMKINMNFAFKHTESAGLLLILASIIPFVFIHDFGLVWRILFLLGVVFVGVHRLLSEEGSLKQSLESSGNDLKVRRLHRQRVFGLFFLCMCVLLLFINEGFYFGCNIRRPLWFLPFLIFTVVEVYTAFRLPSRG